ncbi:MAG: acyl-phosphate glycerol 3-phosphate acyltransferase, partial [Lachnospiraceae bacterium]|nr:acyl-phosphate glycerol 3-phosphate acyltransferase [Lachnospiraceae bacterium]
IVEIELVVGLVVLGQMGYYGMDQAHRMEFYLLAAALCVMAIWRHRKNIARLVNGTENKVFQKKK